MTAQLDLLLIHPGSRTQVYQSLGEDLTAIEPPVWAAMLATFVRERGYSVALLDAEAEGLSPAQVGNRIASERPVLTAVVVYGHQPSASTQNMTAASRICAEAKARAPEVSLLLLGGHVAALPRRTLEEEAADFVCGGEGPCTLVDLLEALTSTQPDALEKVRGLYYRKDGRITSNASAPLVKDLEHEIPRLAWDLLPMDRYRAHNWHCFGHLQRQPYAALYTTLGCPYHCSFCCIQAPFKSGEQVLGYRESVNTYRFWSPSSVVAQIDHLVGTYGVRNIKLADEMFVLNKRHVLSLCDLIIERGYNLNIWAYARVDTVRDQETLQKLKRAGFNWLAFGIESASERVRDDVRKGFDQDDIFKTLAMVRSAGINVMANFIFGLPEDDLDSMQATLRLALDLRCEFANFYCAMAYPGSQLYNVALANGWPLPDTWSGYSQHSVETLPLPTKHLSAADVLAFRDNAFHTYFSDPGYLAFVQERFGPETVAHIARMTGHRLERRYARPTAETGGDAQVHATLPQLTGPP